MFHKYVATVSLKCFICFSLYVAASVFMLQVFYLDIAYVSHIRCKCMLHMVNLFQKYVVFKCFYVVRRVRGREE
jgi:hypothetical protein